MSLQMCIIIRELRIVTYVFSSSTWEDRSRFLPTSVMLVLPDEVRTALVAPETNIAT